MGQQLSGESKSEMASPTKAFLTQEQEKSPGVLKKRVASISHKGMKSVSFLDSYRRTASETNSPPSRKLDFVNKLKPKNAPTTKNQKFIDLRKSISGSFALNEEQISNPRTSVIRSKTPLPQLSEDPELRFNTIDSQTDRLQTDISERSHLRKQNEVGHHYKHKSKPSSSTLQSTVKITKGLAVERTPSVQIHQQGTLEFQSASTLDLSRNPKHASALYFKQKRYSEAVLTAASSSAAPMRNSFTNSQRSLTPNQTNSKISELQRVAHFKKTSGIPTHSIDNLSFGTLSNSSRHPPAVLHVKSPAAMQRYRSLIRHSQLNQKYNIPSHSIQLSAQREARQLRVQHNSNGGKIQQKRPLSAMSRTPRQKQPVLQQYILQEEKHQASPPRRTSVPLRLSQINRLPPRVPTASSITTPHLSAFKMKSLPSQAVACILEFSIDKYRDLLRVNRDWRLMMSEGMDSLFREVETGFINTCAHDLLFKESKTETRTMSFSGQKGLKIDRILKSEPFTILTHKSVSIAYTFKYYGEKEVYRSEYRFDVIKRGARVIWLHKDNLQFIGDPEGRAYSQVIPPLCLGDNLEIAVNLYSMRGLVDPTSISWEEPRFFPIPRQNALNYVKQKVSFFSGRKPLPPVQDGIRKIFADLNRICEIQDQELEWYEKEYYPRKDRTPDLTYLLKLFKIKKELYAGVDLTVCKIHLLAHKPGSISDKRLGTRILVRQAKQELTNEVKKLGIMIDRHTPLELRIGDTLILYISLGRTPPSRKTVPSPNRSLQTSKTSGGVNHLSISNSNRSEVMRRSSYILGQSNKVGLGMRDSELLRSQMSAQAQEELQKRASFLRAHTTLPARQSSVSDRLN